MTETVWAQPVEDSPGRAAPAVRPFTDDRIEQAAAMMARAFFDYPMWQWVLPDEPHRREALLVSARASVLSLRRKHHA